MGPDADGRSGPILRIRQLTAQVQAAVKATKSPRPLGWGGQFCTLEEAANRLDLGLGADEFKWRLKTEWTAIRSFRDGPTLRFRRADIDELARSLGLPDDPGLTLGPPAASWDDILAARSGEKPEAAADRDVPADITPDKPSDTSAGKPTAAGFDSRPTDAVRIPSPDDAPAASDADSSEFELSLDADSDSFDIQLSTDSGSEVDLGAVLKKPVRGDPQGDARSAKEINPLNLPVMGDDDSSEFELTLDDSADDATRTLPPQAVGPTPASRDDHLDQITPANDRLDVPTLALRALNVAAVSNPPTRTLTHADGHGPLPDLTLVLDKYTLVRHLGEGSFGTVFLAHPKDQPDELVAIKFFVYGSTRRWRQLQAEVQRLSGLEGVPGIVGLLDVNADADPPHFVMRYAAGGSLADRLKRDGPLPAAAVARLAGRIAAALAAVHARGVVHCDLKPGNVLLDEYDQPLLADFGQAQLVGEDAPALGTLFYMPPDQADPTPRRPDPRWDVYALGALLYALLTGRPPHQRETLRADLDDTVTLGEKLRRYRAALKSAPPPCDHRRCCPDGRLCGVIDRCLCVDPASRYPDATAVLADLSAGAG